MKLHLKDNPNLALTYAGSANLAKITDLFVKGCGSIDRLALLKAILATPSKTLKYIAMELGQNTGGVLSDIDTIYQLLHETSGVKDYGRVTYADGQFDHTLAQFPELTGSLTIQQGDHSYDAKCAEIQEKLGFIITMLSFFIQFEDPEVERVLKANGVGTAEGITAEQLAAVTSIGTWFRGNTVITKFPELKNSGVTGLSSGAFSGCSNLLEIDLSGITWMTGQDIFANCTNLIIPELDLTNYTVLEASVFRDYDGIQTVKNFKFSNTVFSNKQSLTSVTCAESLQLCDNMFSQCQYLTNLVLPPNVTSIPYRLCWRCYRLKITLPDTITSIGDSAFQDCTSLDNTSLPSSLLTIGNSAFHGCTRINITQLPSGLTSIGVAAFAGCSSNTLNKIPDNVTSLGSTAFHSNAMTSMDIPAGISSLSYLFRFCQNLTTVIVRATTPPSFDRVFEGSNIGGSGTHIYVPASAVADYQAASGWSVYASIISAIPE